MSPKFNAGLSVKKDAVYQLDSKDSKLVANEFNFKKFNGLHPV
jgi:hypothetical protein